LVEYINWSAMLSGLATNKIPCYMQVIFRR
jgi:hypothetical protein